MKKQTSVTIIFLVTAIFLGLAIPFYLAPYGFYNGFPWLTSFVPIGIVLAAGLAIVGILYYFLEKTNASKRKEKRV